MSINTNATVPIYTSERIMEAPGPNTSAEERTKYVIEGLKRMYKQKVLPVEQLYKFDIMNSPSMTDTEFESFPQVLMIGQYSTGKTTFIEYILGEEFPGQR